MRITIVGAGAIGGTTGAFLARAGEDVLFVDVVQEHVDAINRRGLTITGRDEFTVQVPAITPRRPLRSAGLGLPVGEVPAHRGGASSHRAPPG